MTHNIHSSTLFMANSFMANQIVTHSEESWFKNAMWDGYLFCAERHQKRPLLVLQVSCVYLEWIISSPFLFSSYFDCVCKILKVHCQNKHKVTKFLRPHVVGRTFHTNVVINHCGSSSLLVYFCAIFSWCLGRGTQRVSFSFWWNIQKKN